MFHFYDYGRKGISFYVLLPYDSQNARYTSTIDGCMCISHRQSQFISFLFSMLIENKHVWRIKQCKSRVLLEWLFQSRACKAFFGGVGKYLLMTPMWLVYLFDCICISKNHIRVCKVNMVIWRMLRLCDYILILQIDTVCIYKYIYYLDLLFIYVYIYTRFFIYTYNIYIYT